MIDFNKMSPPYRRFGFLRKYDYRENPNLVETISTVDDYRVYEHAARVLKKRDGLQYSVGVVAVEGEVYNVWHSGYKGEVPKGSVFSSIIKTAHPGGVFIDHSPFWEEVDRLKNIASEI